MIIGTNGDGAPARSAGMKSVVSAAATLLVAIIVLWALFKLLGLAVKLAAVLVIVGIVVALYFAAQKYFGKA
jgi:Na+/H+-translocating membrane pyrophosphatase